ncbi:hypothetical protein [Streptomyces sp. NPDC050263]|uniref:hypothetical protein n=1 Tax=Streptomyces sp. NPDC050263 TaxID=3155037 RepID=UPI003423E1F3
MASAQNSNEVGWRVTAGIGSLGVGIGLIAGIPVLSLLGAVVVLVGLIGLTAARRK